MKGRQDFDNANRFMLGWVLVTLVIVVLVLFASGFMVADDILNHRGEVETGIDGDKNLHAPINLIVADGILWWDVVSSAKSYAVKFEGQEYERATQYSFFVLHELEEGNTYALTVVAIGDNDNVSPRSERFQFVYNSPHMPQTPKLDEPSLSTSDRDTMLAWQMVLHSACFSISCNHTEVAQVQSLSFAIANLPKGNKNIRIRALSGQSDFDHSDWSNTISIGDSIPDPDTPSLLSTPQISIQGTQIKWEQVEGATSYDMLLNGTELASIESIKQMVKETGFVDITIRARNASSESNWSNTVRYSMPA